ncbi:DUF6082 family protein [Micromonospora sp. NPDC005197]|uniref:DUF6082 family protein n=1 Tax=Micromonospora sp. NPDC005197 TaxID=3157020 RepID=UPI00339ED424
MPRLRMVSYLARRPGTPMILPLAVLAMLAAVLFSPAVLLWIGRRPGYDWPLLGNVGQTYGAASAILAALALIGVVASLALQAREAKAAREQALRALHTDLLKMAIDDPALLECWGPIEDAVDVEWFRKHVYANLIVSHWQLMWEVDVLTAQHLEVLADQFFKGHVGRRFWAEARGPTLVAADCPSGWYCFYEWPNYGYPRGRLSDCGRQSLATWQWQFRVESAHYNLGSGSVSFYYYDTRLFDIGAANRVRGDASQAQDNDAVGLAAPT